MISNIRKEEVCNKYKEYLEVINKLCNKIMLQKHLEELCIKLNIAKDKFDVLKAVQELEKAEIIKKIRFMSSTNKFIIFKKYAIRYLQKADSSQAVSAVAKINTNRRYYESIFKTNFIIKVIIQSMIKANIDLNLENLLKFIDSINCNILYNKNNISDFYRKNLFKYKNYLNRSEVDKDINALDQQKENMLKNLNGEKTTSVKSKRKTKIDFLTESTIATLVRRDIYIAQIVKKDNSIIISAYFFDISNSQNAVNIALNYSICYRVFKRLFKCNIKLYFRVCTTNLVAERNLMNEFDKRSMNPISKELRTEQYLMTLLRSNHLNELDWQYMHIKIINYDIER